MAPEIVKNIGYNYKCDIWSLGCTTYEMAVGYPPWYDKTKDIVQIFYILTDDKQFPTFPDHVSVELKDFILCCLNRQPDNRPDANSLNDHKFMKSREQINNNKNLKDIEIFIKNNSNSFEFDKEINNISKINYNDKKHNNIIIHDFDDNYKEDVEPKQ
jgi:serine/threonine protein kinase